MEKWEEQGKRKGAGKEKSNLKNPVPISVLPGWTQTSSLESVWLGAGNQDSMTL